MQQQQGKQQSLAELVMLYPLLLGQVRKWQLVVVLVLLLLVVLLWPGLPQVVLWRRRPSRQERRLPWAR